MSRLLTLLSSLVVLADATIALAQLPKNDGDDSSEIEPPLLMQNLAREPQPPADATATPEPMTDPDDLETALERAKKNEKSAERLVKIGALAKVEAEQRALRVVRLQSTLENARLARAKEEVRQSRLAAGEISQTEVAQAETVLAQAIAAAQTAAANRERAELAAAESNLHRQQKLLALGSGRKSEVSRAEQRLAELKAPKN